MSTRVWHIFATVAVVLQVGVSPQTGATVEGVVLDAAVNEPLAGAQVVLYPAEPPVVLNPQEPPASPPQATTDSQGRFSIRTNQTGRFRVVATKGAFIFTRSLPSQLPGAWVELSADKRIEGLQLRMTRPAAISGRVMDSKGQAIGVLVILNSYTYAKDGKRALQNVLGLDYGGRPSSQETNDKGEFRFYDLPSGEYYLTFLTGSLNVVHPGVSYYPGVTDEVKALPIQVRNGQEIQLGTISLPVRPNPVELRLHITGPPERDLRPQIGLGTYGTRRGLPSNPGEIAFQVVPGHYDITVSDSGPYLQQDYYYERISIDVGPSNAVYDVVLKRAPHLTGTMVLENAAGERRTAPSTIRCTLDGPYTRDCLRSQPEPGSYGLEFQGLPRDAYVLSAKVGDKDILAEGLSITADTELEIVLVQTGAIVYGTVHNSSGDVVPDATVALIPEAPYRNAGPRYRSVITDHKGQFEIHGIAPASYKLFAWSELEGAAYRNPDFMKEFEDRGKPVDVQKSTRKTVDLVAF